MLAIGKCASRFETKSGYAQSQGPLGGHTASNGRAVTYCKATGSADFQSGGFVMISRYVTTLKSNHLEQQVQQVYKVPL
jgi:hypothetical protein